MGARIVRWALVGAWILLAITAGLFAYRGPVRALQRGAPDYALYYASTRAWLQGRNCWDPTVLEEVTRGQELPTGLFENALAPPMSYVPLVPLALLDYRLSLAIWTALNCLGVLVMLKMLAILAHLPLSPRCPRCVLMTAFVLGLAPLQTCIGFGQLAVLALAFSVVALVLDKADRRVPAGLCFALSALLKPQLAVGFLLYWVLLKRWRVLVPAGIAVAAVSAAACVRLWLSLPGWLQAYRAQSRAMLQGGYGDYASRTSAYIYAQLQFPLFRIFHSKLWASAVAWTLAGGLLVWLIVILRTRYADRWKKQDKARLLTVCALGLWQILPIYHVYYDAAVAALPIAWACAELFIGHQRGLAKLFLVLSAGLLLPIAPGLNWLARRGHLGSFPQTWIYQSVVVAYLPWLLLVMTFVLLAALRGQAGQPPATTNSID
jgi:hypothetical protein